MADEELYVLLARIRDSFDAVTMEIDKFLGAKTKEVLKEYDVEKISWATKEGNKGPFELCDPRKNVDNSDYKALLADLKAHNNRMSINKKFYWLFGNGETIGRK
jgi:hypothetical protein